MAKQEESVSTSGVAALISASTATDPDWASIAALAYQLWLARGCPIGSDQDDWFLAESILRREGEEAPSVSE
jgi:hypothetical protein